MKQYTKYSAKKSSDHPVCESFKLPNIIPLFCPNHGPRTERI